MSTVLDNDTADASLSPSDTAYGTMVIPKRFLQYHSGEAVTTGRICSWPESVGSKG